MILIRATDGSIVKGNNVVIGSNGSKEALIYHVVGDTRIILGRYNTTIRCEEITDEIFKAILNGHTHYKMPSK